MKLAEAMIMFHSISRALEASISPLWVEIGSIIIWNLLIGKDRYVNEVRLLLMLFGRSIGVALSLGFCGQTSNITRFLMN